MYIGKFHKFKVAGICVAGIQDGHLSYIVNSVSDALNKKGYKVLIFNSFSDFYNESPFISGESSIYRLINFELLDVLVIFPETIKNSRITDEIVINAAQHNTPVISVDSECEGCTNIVYNYSDSFEEMVRHVVEKHGCTDIYMVAGMHANRFSDERIEAYKKVLAENNIPFDKNRVGYGDFWTRPTKQLMDNFFANNEKMPQAFICANDTMAITVARCLRDNGYRVPEDVIVTGFDATYIDRYFTTSEISSAILDTNELADLIVKTADGYFEGTETPQTKTISFRIVPAHSCGCVTIDREFVNDKLLKMDDYTAATQANETFMSEYSAHTVTCKTLDEITTAMATYADYLSWICINNDFLAPDIQASEEEVAGVFTKTMISILQRQYDTSIKNQVFDVKMLLPDLGKALKLYNKLVFIPLHFQANVIGYYCVVTDNFEVGSNAFYDTRRFVNNTNQILENFKNKYKLQRAYDALEITHSFDPLTGIYNRSGFFAEAKRLLGGSAVQELLIISIDMDSLKEINDNYGHADGDEAICEVAKALKSVCKNKSICARFGGDEFVAAIPCSSDMRIAPKIIGDIQTHIDCYNRASDKQFEVSISIGAYQGKVSNFYDLSEMIKKSDHSMYEQKRTRKGQKSSVTPAANSESSENNTIGIYEKRIHDILASGNDCTYFYMSYENSKWYIMENENTPPCMISSSVGPLRSIWLSGNIFADDIPIFNEFATKISKAFIKGIKEKELPVSIRLVENGEPVWYNIFVILYPGNDGRLSEMAGMIRRTSSYEIMQMEILNYYTTTDNPLMITENIKSLIHNKEGRKYAFIHFDIKRFKFINETYGEDVGTELLYHITRQLKTFCDPDQLSARLNSDIFLLLTPYESKDAILSLIRKVEKDISGFRNLKYEFSFGVYIADDLSLPVRVMGDRASIARQTVKNNAIENIAFYDNDMLKKAKIRKFVESSMNSALENQQFSIYLQPKFSISRKEAVGYEALVRWLHPERGMISPGDFIPLFEENGFILKLDAYVWECACQVLRDWIDRGFTPLPISVNVSRAHLKDDTFISILDKLVSKYRLPKKLLELEITESIEGSDTTAMTQEIKNHGYILLMDDFGSGYSSLNTLKSTKFDILKIDREFLSSFMSSERGKKIISHTILMSQDVGLDLIAEGVETPEQAEFLENCGCDTAQGFYYAKPMPVQDAEMYLLKKQ